MSTVFVNGLSMRVKLIILFGIILLTSLISNRVVFAETKTTVTSILSDTEYETELYTINSNKPGPTVMVVGGVHGNEPSGYLSADDIKDWKISSGKLIVLPEANVKAIKADKRTAPGEKDLNRSFPQKESESADNKLATEIYSIAKSNKINWLIDLHEGYDYVRVKSNDSVGQSVIYYPTKEAKSISNKIVKNLNTGIKTNKEKFKLLRYPVKGSLARSSAECLDANAMIVETCTKSPLSTRKNYHERAVNLVLKELHMK